MKQEQTRDIMEFKGDIRDIVWTSNEHVQHWDILPAILWTINYSVQYVPDIRSLRFTPHAERGGH